MSTSVPLLKVKDLTVSYGEEKVLDHLSLEIPDGIVCAILGPNGAGKSTLLRSSLGLIRREGGEIEILGKKYSEARKEIAYLPQIRKVRWDFPITVFEVALMGRYSSLGWIRRPGAKDRKIAEEALERMGMLSFKDRQISELSGGQRQRVFLARALAENPKAYFLDEPLTGVDETTEQVVISFLKEEAKRGKGSIAVHHDLHSLEAYFDYAVLLTKEGVVSMPPKELLQSEILKKTYGGFVNT